MIELKHKVGDKVLVKDLEWYNKNKNENDEVMISALGPVFTRRHSKYAGKVMTVGIVSKLGFYVLKEDKEGNRWYDEMFDTLVEEEIKPKFKVGDKITNGEITFTILTLSSDRYGAEDTFGECGSVCFKSQDEWEIVEEECNYVRVVDDTPNASQVKVSSASACTHNGFYGYSDSEGNEISEWNLPEGYQFKDENGNVINATKIVLEKKKKEVTYPKTYEECAEIIAELTGSDCNPKGCMGYMSVQLTALQKLLICRDAYWKIAGEEMGLNGPWKPDWTANDKHFYTIHTFNGKIE